MQSLFEYYFLIDKVKAYNFQYNFINNLNFINFY